MTEAATRPLEPFTPPAWDGRLPPGIDGHWPDVPAEEVHGPDESALAWCAHAALATATTVLAAMPDRVLDVLGAGLARIARVVDRRHADAARRFLSIAFPGLDRRERERFVLGAYRHLLDVVVTSRRLESRAPGPWVMRNVEFFADADARALLARPGGRVMITAHVGDWEYGSALMPWIGCAPGYVIGKPPKNAYVSRAMLRARERRGLRVLPRRGAMAAAPAILAAGGSIAMLLDQRARTKPVLAPFFGRPARCDRSAGVLLKRLRAPVLFAYCLRLPGRPRRYRFEVGPVLAPETVASWTPEQLAARINAEFERRIRAHPEQYFWLHDRYKDTPESADG